MSPKSPMPSPAVPTSPCERPIMPSPVRSRRSERPGRRWGCWLLLMLLWGGLPGHGQAAAPVLPVRVEATLPHDPNAFTQGLLYHNGFFYESTGRYGQSDLRRVSPATGQVLARRRLPAHLFGEGLALADGRLLQLTWKEGRVLVSSAANLAPIDEFPLAGEGWGACALEDGRLAVSDGSARLTFYEPGNFTRRGSLTVTDDGRPIDRLNELEAVSGTIWANVWGKTRIAVIDPESGHVLAWVDCAALMPDGAATDRENVLNGIAFDAMTGRLWVTGKRWPKLYLITVPGLPAGTRRK